MICPECGRRLKAKACWGGPYAKEDREYRYYRCARKNVGNCDFGTVAEAKIEKYLLENIRSEMEKFLLSTEAESHEEAKRKPKKNDVEKLQEKLRRLNVAFFAGNMDDDEYAKQAKAIKDQIATAQAEEVKTEKPVDTEAVKAFLAMDFESIYSELSHEEQRTLWRSVIAQLIPDGSDSVRIIFKA